jgi:hypothetical protein
VRLLLTEPTGTSLDELVPGGAYWRVTPDGKRWSYYNAAPLAPAGIYRVVIDARKNPARFKLKGRKGTYNATMAVEPTLEMPDSEECFAARFPGPTAPVCTLKGEAGRQRLICR